jgi:hypothetical protein
MPVEFWVAVYRFGHSMIRPDYRLNLHVLRAGRCRRTLRGGARRLPVEDPAGTTLTPAGTSGPAVV